MRLRVALAALLARAGKAQVQVLAGASDRPRRATASPPRSPPRSRRARWATGPRTCPTRNTASHSRPLAAWIVLRVTPSTDGRVLGRGALGEVLDEVPHRAPSPVAAMDVRIEVVGKLRRAPAGSPSARAPRRARQEAPRPTSALKRRAHLGASGSSDAATAAPRSSTHRLADLVAPEEPLAAAHQVADAARARAPPRAPPTGCWCGTARRSRGPRRPPTSAPRCASRRPPPRRRRPHRRETPRRGPRAAGRRVPRRPTGVAR